MSNGMSNGKSISAWIGQGVVKKRRQTISQSTFSSPEHLDGRGAPASRDRYSGSAQAAGMTLAARLSQASKDAGGNAMNAATSAGIRKQNRYAIPLVRLPCLALVVQRE